MTRPPNAADHFPLDTDALAERLRNLRSERGWTLREASSFSAEVAFGHLGRLERGEMGQVGPSVATLLALADLYTVPVMDLLDTLRPRNPASAAQDVRFTLQRYPEAWELLKPG